MKKQKLKYLKLKLQLWWLEQFNAPTEIDRCYKNFSCNVYDRKRKELLKELSKFKNM